MAVAASGILSEPMADLAALIASSSTFQDWVGASDKAAALDRIYLYCAEVGEYERPCAMIMSGDEWELLAVQAGMDGLEHVASGTLGLVFEAAIGNEALSAEQEAAIVALILEAASGIAAALGDGDYASARAESRTAWGHLMGLPEDAGGGEAALSIRDSLMTFENTLGGIWADVQALADRDSIFALRRVRTMPGQPQMIGEAERKAWGASTPGFAHAFEVGW